MNLKSMVTIFGECVRVPNFVDNLCHKKDEKRHKYCISIKQIKLNCEVCEVCDLPNLPNLPNLHKYKAFGIL